jgi:hypothetical protein
LQKTQKLETTQVVQKKIPWCKKMNNARKINNVRAITMQKPL